MTAGTISLCRGCSESALGVQHTPHSHRVQAASAGKSKGGEFALDSKLAIGILPL